MARTLTDYNGIICWCDVAHVSVLTGVTATPNDMSRAQGIISVNTDVWPDELPDDLKPADQRRMADALAYEAAWLHGQVDLFSESSVTNVSQDGIQANYVSEYSQYIAPLAMVCLKRLSWNRAGTLTKRPGGKYADIPQAAAAVLRDEACDPSAVGGYVPGRPFS